MLNLKKLAERVRQPQNEKGQGLVEYALILVLVAIVVIAVLLLLGPQISGVFIKVACAVEGHGQCAGPYVSTAMSTDEMIADACKSLTLKSGTPVYVAGLNPTLGANKMMVTTSNKAGGTSGQCP